MVPQEASDAPTLDTLDELVDLVDEHSDACVRYSRGPKHDTGRPSIDYESGLELPGLSANPLAPEPWWTRDVRDWLARQICHYVHLGDEPGRRAWVLKGDVVGYGPDREPLIGAWQVLAFLSEHMVEEARRRYEERFEVGRDSTHA